MFPVAILVATTAMASGIGGATFFAPIMLLGLGLPPEVAIGTGLITEVFGFTSGLYAYARKRLIDYRLGIRLISVAVPAAILGSFLAGSVGPEVLKTMLGIGLLGIAAAFLRSNGHHQVDPRPVSIRADGVRLASVTTAVGETIEYDVCDRLVGGIAAGVGGLFLGLISAGLGELNSYYLLQQCRMPSRVAVATGVFVVAITAFSAAGGHLYQFVHAGPEVMDTVWRIVRFTVPGVIVGAQLGSYVSTRIPQSALERLLGVLFTLIGLLMLGQVIFL